HRERRARALATPADDRAVEDLSPLLLALDDLHVHAGLVAGIEPLPVLLQLPRLHDADCVHGPRPFLCLRGRRYDGVSPRSNRSMSCRSSSVRLASVSSSGRRRQVSQSACSRRQRATRAWSPDSSTAGTRAPRNSSGRVYCGGSSRPLANDSRSAAPSAPSAPGSNRVTASVTMRAGSSPPVT